jgi:MFS family permease
MSRAHLIACVLLPFAAGYYLSYLFRTINALIAGDLMAELGLNAADLGFLTSVYFLVFAAVQLPLGALLDRYGPRMIQSSLLLLASAGSLVFALADGLFGLLVGRALLGLGVALALMAGFKAIALWFPPGRIALANGWLVMLGALGAVTATAPAELVVQALGWRGLFALLAGLFALAALLVLLAVPEPTGTPAAPTGAKRVNLWAIYRDRRFWRIAPLSAVGIGTSWSLQGLWAAPWLRDVNGLQRSDVVQHLGVMAIAVCLSALLLGTATDRLRRRGVKTESVLASMLVLSIAAQTGLVCAWPIPAYLLWAVVAAAGAATVLSFAILSEYFPKEMSGRANAALNVLHVGGAFVLQSATGLIIELWPTTNGTYPSMPIRPPWPRVSPCSWPRSLGSHWRREANQRRRCRAWSRVRPPAAGHNCRRPRPATPLASGASRAELAVRPLDGVLRPLHRPHSAWRWQRRWRQRSVMQILLPISSMWIGPPSVPTAQPSETPWPQRLPRLPFLPGWRCCGKFQPNEPRTVAACI